MQNPQKKKVLISPCFLHRIEGCATGHYTLEVLVNSFIHQGGFDMHTDIKGQKKKVKTKTCRKKKESSYLALLLQLDRRIFQRSSQHDLGVLTTSFNPQGEFDMTIEIKMAKTNQKKIWKKKKFLLHPACLIG